MLKEFEIINYNTAKELEYRAKNNFVIYGDLDNSNRFEYINIAKSRLECGIAYNYTGIHPEVLVVNDKVAFIGFDKTILCVDQGMKKLISENQIESLFYEFINIASESLVVIIFELDLMVVDYRGNIIWSIGFKDIIEDFQIEKNEVINIKCIDDSEFKFELLTGRYI